MTKGTDAAASLAEFVDLWQKFRVECEAPGTLVVVEGERDRRSIARLGIPATIFILHGGRTLAQTAQELVRRSRRVVVLTDWDTEGGHLAHRLSEFLEAERLELDLLTRRRLAHVLRGELVHVEGLYGWARRLAEKQGDLLEALLGPVEPSDELRE
ncbi:MAG: toprim domain-containing protein [Thermoplasmata archaeon]|nr:toprim domain-containing protein [Thermoplasmata archaeon]